MVFSSPVFVFIFLPAVFFAVTAVMLCGIKSSLRVKIANVLLLFASLFFYAWGEPLLIFLMVGVTLLCYLFALLTERFKDNPVKKKAALICAVVSALGILVFFKYAGFLADIFTDKTLNVPLPLGISFYTFQALSYVIDVYNGKATATKNFGRVLLYVSLFPQLVAGPIVKYSDVDEQLVCRNFNIEEAAHGLRRFICGLAKKMLIANTVAVVADGVFALGSAELTGASAWCGALAYLFQIYFDFSGYSDMAIGLGAMFGFKFNENFNYPYSATSVQDFWRRWHISVSSWFKEYLYFPLGGNRKGRFRTCVNKIIVFFFTGLWHGAAFTFIVWGLWHGLFLLLEEYLPKLKKQPSSRFVKGLLCVVKYIYTMTVVLFGFVIFRAESMSQALTYMGKMITDIGSLPSALAPAMVFVDGYTVVMFILAAVLSFPVTRKICDMARKKGERAETVCEVLSFAGTVLLFGACVLSLAASSYNPFIYFRF